MKKVKKQKSLSQKMNANEGQPRGIYKTDSITQTEMLISSLDVCSNVYFSVKEMAIGRTVKIQQL